MRRVYHGTRTRRGEVSAMETLLAKVIEDPRGVASPFPRAEAAALASGRATANAGHPERRPPQDLAVSGGPDAPRPQPLVQPPYQGATRRARRIPVMALAPLDVEIA